MSVNVDAQGIDLDRLAIRRLAHALGHLDEIKRVLALAEECLIWRAETRGKAAIWRQWDTQRKVVLWLDETPTYEMDAAELPY